MTLVRSRSVEMGGTPNLAVRDGNLPPRNSDCYSARFNAQSPPRAVALVARQNGQVGRSTQLPTASFRLRILALAALLALSTLPLLAHDEDSKVEVRIDRPSRPAGALKLDLTLVESEKSVTDQDLKIHNENKLHAFVYDEALIEYHHEHPEYVSNRWTLPVTLERDGRYYIWVQGMFADDDTEFSAYALITITNGLPANPTPPKLGNIRTGSVGNSRIALSDLRLRAGQTAMPLLSITRSNGTQPQITPYLGALAHVLIVSSEGDNILHVHPMAGSSATELMVHTSFPAAGDYRVWVQFQDGGVLKTVPLAVSVTP